MAVTVARLFVGRLAPRRTPRRRLLVFDTSYDLRTMRERELLPLIMNRDLNGWFEAVWTVHPMVGASPEHAADASGAPTITRLNHRHVVIEGHVRERYIPKALPRLSAAIAQARALWLIGRIVHREQIGVVQVGDPFYGFVGLAVARAFRLPFVIRIGQNFDKSNESIGAVAHSRLIPSRRAEVAIQRFVLRRADLVLAANEDNLRYATSNGAAASRGWVIPAYGNVIHPTHLEDPLVRSAPELPHVIEGRRYAICVGRLEPIKHPEDVLRAIALAKAECPDLGLVLVGDGSMRRELEGMANELDLGDRVFFAGNRGQQWIAEALAHADVVLSPLTGRALVEAALSATPIVAYDYEWQSEVVENGRTGVLVPYRSVEGMAAAVRQLLADRRRAEDLGQSARAEVLDRIEPTVLASRLAAAYAKVL